MVAFQWDAIHNVWTHGSKVMRFLRFQPKFGHALNHYQCNKICPKLPKTTEICQNLPKDRTLKYYQKSRFQCSQKIKISACRGGTRACFHRSDFQYKNFLYTIFIVKKRPLYLNFSIPPCGNWWFSQGSTPCVGMRFYGHVPNSPRNKNPKRHISYLLERVVFLETKTLLSSFGRGKKNFFFNFECYDLANGKEWDYKIW
jgi:hypothetical protein